MPEQTTTDPTAPQPDVPTIDENAGMGGSYVIENGVRTLVERTQPPPVEPATTGEGS